MKNIGRIFILSFFLSFAAPALAQDTPAVPELKKGDRLSYIQLRGLLMDYADRYNQMIGQAVDGLQRANEDTSARTGIHSMKLFPCSAAYSIAVDANPQVALLDMGILVYLQGLVWKDTLPKRYGEKAEAMLAAQRSLEVEYDAIASRALTPEKLSWLKSLAEDWRRAHPDQRYVSYIRFTDFSDMRRESWPGKGPNFLSIAGLLSAFQLVNMDETTRSVDEARMLGERGIYLAQRMPSLMRWQMQMLFYDLANTPENRTLMAATKSVADLSAEREAALKQFSKEMKGILWEWVKAVIVLMLVFFALLFVWRATKKS